MAYRQMDSQMMFPAIIRTLQHCAASCEHTANYLLGAGDVGTRRMQIKLLRDCADICIKTAKFVLRSSHFTKSSLLFCADVCEVCGNECLRHSDMMSKHCGQICLQCAKECRYAATTAA